MLGIKRLALLAGLMTCSVIGTARAGDFEHANWTVDSRFLECPKILRGNQTLILTFGANHGSELMIGRANNGAQYEMVVDVPSDDQKPLMTRKQFALARTLRIPATIKWRRVEVVPNTVAGKERIFAEEGRYIVYSSENLYSGAGGYTCTFHYIK